MVRSRSRFLAAAIAVAVLAFPAIALAAEGAASPVPSPAFYSIAISRLKIIEPDTFEISRGGTKPVTVRLADATCEGLEKSQRTNALSLVTDFLEPEPFWVFPCCGDKDKPDTTIRAHVWTKKGWLGEVLIKAMFATRRADPYDGPALAAAKVFYDKAPPPPCEPAFSGVVSRTSDGTSYEVLHDGKTQKVRLFDAACESGSAEDAKGLLAKLAGGDPVWIFPSSQRRLAANEELPVRIWTKEGWLHQALVKGGLAKLYPDPDKAIAPEVAVKPAKPDPAAKKDPPPAKEKPVREPPKHTPTSSDVVWREVPVGQEAGGGRKDAFACQSGVFKITSPEWRLSWDMQPVRSGALIMLSIFRVDEKWESKQSSVQVCTFQGGQGSQIIRSFPGDYWIRVVQSSKLHIKVEVREPAEAPK